GVGELNEMFAAVEEIYIDPLLKQWAVELVRATRSDDAIEMGASVRASLALERIARARALVEGRDYVIAEDIERLFAPVVGHRLILSADALIGSDASESDLLDGILAACLERVPRPEPDWEAGAPPEGQGAPRASVPSPSSHAGALSACGSASIEAHGGDRETRSRARGPTVR